jgi:hypothetical protein
MHVPTACLLTFWAGEASTVRQSSPHRMMDDLTFVHGLAAVATTLDATAFEPRNAIPGPRTGMASFASVLPQDKR